MRKPTTILAGLALTATVTVLPAAPASTTIHEIVAQWCAGKGELQPPGIQDGPVNVDVPSAKVIGTGVYVVVAQTPAGPLSVQLIQPDPSFPAFKRCPKLAG